MSTNIRLGLSKLDETLLEEGLSELVRKHGEDWFHELKRTYLPDPSKGNSRDFLLQVSLLARSVLSVVQTDAAGKSGDVANRVKELLVGLPVLNQWFSAVAERLERSSFFDRSPASQLQTIAALFEDQARLADRRVHKAIIRNYHWTKVVDPRLLMSIGPRLSEQAGVSYITVFQAQGEILELIIRYLLWKHRGQFGKPEKNICPYNDEEVAEVFYLADLQIHLRTIWTAVQHLDWFPTSQDGAVVFLPRSPREYVLSQVAFFREYMYLHQLGLTATAWTAEVDEQRRRFIKYLATSIRRARKNWLSDLSPHAVNKALWPDSVFVVQLDALERQYAVDLRDVAFGPVGHQVSAAALLLGIRFLDVVSEAFKEAVWKSWSSKTRFEELCPIIPISALVRKLSESTRLSLKEAGDVLRLFIFNRDSKELEIWHQPLIPWDQDTVMFLPSIASAIDVYKFFEAHLAASGFAFEERGPVFEEEVRQALRKCGLQVSDKIVFLASDGAEIDYDLLAKCRDFYIVGEVKCLKMPTELGQMHRPWHAIRKGIEQVKRRCTLLYSDWNQVRQRCSFSLPSEPPDPDHVVPLVVTNILTHTGLEVQGVHIADLRCVVRYFSGSPITKQPVARGRFVGEEEVIQEIWANGEPTLKEFVSYLKNPPQVSEMAKLLTPSIQMLPSLSEDLTPLGYSVILSKTPNVLGS